MGASRPSHPSPARHRGLPRHHAIDYDLNPTRTHWALVAPQKATPGLHYLTKHYHRSWLRPDVIAGLAVAAYLIPQVMAYAAIVGVPPVIGLYRARLTRRVCRDGQLARALGRA